LGKKNIDTIAASADMLAGNLIPPQKRHIWFLPTRNPLLQKNQKSLFLSNTLKVFLSN